MAATLAILAVILIAALPATAKDLRSAERPQPRPFAQTSQSDHAGLARLIQASPLSGTTTAVLINTTTGEVVSAYQPNQPMPPASVTKVLTALYGFAKLGPKHAFSTRLLITGSIDGTTLHGDLILEGGGDPELDTDELAKMVEALSHAGISTINGNFFFDDSRMPRLDAIGSGQPPNAAYNPGLSGLNLNFNRIFFEWDVTSDGLDLRLEARDRGHSPSVSAAASIVAEDRPGPVYMYSQRGGAEHWSIARGALRRPGGVWLPVRDPGAYAAEAFAQMARAAGIAMPPPQRSPQIQTTKPAAAAISAITRRPLFEVCRGMLHFSTNVTAELVGLSASQTLSQSPMSGLASSAAHMNGWLASTYGATSQSFKDHSGLSPANRISAQDMAAILQVAAAEGQLDGLLRRHFVAKPGANTPAVKDAEVRAKTGTLNFVRALAGTIAGASGQTYTFAIFSADPAARAQADHSRTNPPGARRFNNRAVYLEQAILARWLTRYAR